MKETKGIVLAVSKQWWLKVNTKPIRRHALDGATFPHIIKAEYTVEGVTYFKRKWIKACQTPPCVGSTVTVQYDSDNPKKAKII